MVQVFSLRGSSIQSPVSAKINIIIGEREGKGGPAQWLESRTTDQGVPGSWPGRVAVRCGLEQVTLPPA